MKIIFGHLDIAYESLIESSEEIFEPQEYFQDTGVFCINFPEVKLPHPLNKGGLVFRKGGSFYSAYFNLIAKKEFVFRNLSKRLGERLEKEMLGWSPMDKNGCGYILDNNKMPIISIIDTGTEGEREIWLGSSGAVSRSLKDIDSFRKDLKSLEKITNITVETCLSSPKVLRKIKYIPKHSIYINS